MVQLANHDEIIVQLCISFKFGGLYGLWVTWKILSIFQSFSLICQFHFVVTFNLNKERTSIYCYRHVTSLMSHFTLQSSHNMHAILKSLSNTYDLISIRFHYISGKEAQWIFIGSENFFLVRRIDDNDTKWSSLSKTFLFFNASRILVSFCFFCVFVGLPHTSLICSHTENAELRNGIIFLSRLDCTLVMMTREIFAQHLNSSSTRIKS
jgi:hypothetical protein